MIQVREDGIYYIHLDGLQEKITFKQEDFPVTLNVTDDSITECMYIQSLLEKLGYVSTIGKHLIFKRNIITITGFLKEKDNKND